MSLDQAERERLATLADILIPASDGMPSASQAGVADEGLDRVLAARPDLEYGLKTLLADSLGRDAAQFVAELRNGRSPAMAVLAEVVPGAYFMNPDVRKAIGYDGQSPQAIDPRPDYMEHDLLAAVIRRGAIFRPTPPAIRDATGSSNVKDD